MTYKEFEKLVEKHFLNKRNLTAEQYMALAKIIQYVRGLTPLERYADGLVKKEGK